MHPWEPGRDNAVEWLPALERLKDLTPPPYERADNRLVDPSQRGLGVGNALVKECLAFARAAGYRKVTLWTQSILSAARKLYEGHGFRKVAAEPHESFGARLIAETWELEF